MPEFIQPCFKPCVSLPLAGRVVRSGSRHGCVHKVAQSCTERKPTVHKLLAAAQSDPETGVYKRPVQPLRTHRVTLVASRVHRCKQGESI